MSTPSPLPAESQAQVAALREAVTDEVSALMTDNDCMRFVRARKSDITKAAAMASDWAAWWQTPFADEELKDITPRTILRVQEVDPNEQIYTELVSEFGDVIVIIVYIVDVCVSWCDSCMWLIVLM